MEKVSNEKQIVEALDKIVNAPDIEVKPLLRLKHISHLDLDGYGATFLSKILMNFFPDGAMTLETANILPNKLISEIEKTLENIDDYDLIVITDLAINQKIIDIITNNPEGNKFRIFDHHVSEIDKKPENFVITEKSPLHPNKLTCATELYYNFIKNDKVYGLIHDQSVRRMLAYLVECIRVYDTFEFWSTRNDPINEIDMSYYDAPRLNTLFHIMSREEFIDYLEKRMYSPTSRLTTSNDEFPWISKILELENNKNTKYVESAIRRMARTPFKYTIYKDNVIYKLEYNIGVIFAEKSSPVIANTALERFDDIDFCAVVSNNQISIYSNRPNVDVSKIAMVFGGGGHKEAAGFTIPYINASVFNMNHFKDIVMCAGHLNQNDYNYNSEDVTDTN